MQIVCTLHPQPLSLGLVGVLECIYTGRLLPSTSTRPSKEPAAAFLQELVVGDVWSHNKHFRNAQVEQHPPTFALHGCKLEREEEGGRVKFRWCMMVIIQLSHIDLEDNHQSQTIAPKLSSSNQSTPNHPL